MKKLTMAAILMASTTVALADNVIVTETQSWKTVPITVDTTGNVYTVEGTVPESGDYYYTYSGYRCFTAERTNAGVKPLMFKPKTGTGSAIYCYSEN